MPESIEKLVKLAQGGSKEAFIELIEANKLSLTRAAMSILHNEDDTADAVAETVMKAFSGLCGLRSPKHFKTWLTRILIFSCCDILRQKKRYIPMEELPGPTAAFEPEPQSDIRESLMALGDDDRLILTLYYMDGFKQREIAKMLGIKESAVKSRMLRGRKRLREIYMQGEEDNNDARNRCKAE